MRAKSRLCVGVDIGASGIKLCQLVEGRDGLRVHKLAYAPLPPETIVDGSVMISSRVVGALTDLYRQHRIREKHVAVAISGHSVIIKRLTLPLMERDELEASVALEAETLIPFDIADVYLDVQPLPGEVAPSGQMQVLFVAAKKDYVHEYTAVLAEAGLRPVVCDVDAFAMETAFVHGYAPTGEVNVALMNVGAAKTTLNILSGATSGMTRELSMGGNVFTEGVQRTLKFSFDQAEQYKTGRLREAVAPPLLAKLSQSLTESVDLLAEEVQGSFDIFAANDSRGAPIHLYLTGGSGHMPGLVAGLKRKLNIEVSALDPFRNVQVSGVDGLMLQQMRLHGSVAIGLAMRFAGDC